jgi:hypothetical protein
VPLFIFLLLTLACALASFALACATPFSAFAVVAAAALPLSSALFVVAATWIVNQAIGFGALHYPVDADAIMWGAVIGAAALIGTLAAAAVVRLAGEANGFVARSTVLFLALAAAYAVYELVQIAVTPFLGGEGAFTAGIIGQIGVTNVLWLIGLVAALETARLIIQHSRRQAPPHPASL